MNLPLVDLSDPTPPYEQLRRAILAQIASGSLRPGDRLPSIRALARDLGLAAGTVARAVKELEQAGTLVTRRGAGTRVAPASSSVSLPDAAVSAPAQRLSLEGVLEPVLREALEAGYTPEQIEEQVRRLLH